MRIIENQPTTYGASVDIRLSGSEVATAIAAYLVARGVHVSGPRTITVNGDLIQAGRVHVDPSGFVVARGVRYGRKDGGA